MNIDFSMNFIKNNLYMKEKVAFLVQELAIVGTIQTYLPVMKKLLLNLQLQKKLRYNIKDRHLTENLKK